MKHISSDTYTIAWFKLAECVSRGEKERAFGVYRLLSHSFEDRALALQLEGDLFLSFSMPHDAIQRYEQAAALYKKRGRLLESASVYEHLHTLDAHNEQYCMQLVALYSTLQFKERVADLAADLVTMYVRASKFDEVRKLAKTIDQLEYAHARATCYQRVVQTLLAMPNVPEHVALLYIERTVDALLREGNNQAMQTFITHVKTTNEALYNAARELLHKKA